MTTITKTRGILYRLARGLGWLRAAEDVAEGRSDRAAKIVGNKLIGRKLVSKVWWR